MVESFGKQSKPLLGRLSVPGDKSITHRAYIFQSISEGRFLTNNPSPAEDCLSTIRFLAGLGVDIKTLENGSVEINGRGLYGFSQPASVLDAGNSGTTARILPALLAAQPMMTASINGDSSLRKRPMNRIIKPLTEMGAVIKSADGGFLPLSIEGRELSGGRFETKVASAQVKTALLLAGLYAKGETTVVEPHASRDHTERMLEYFGAKISAKGNTVAIHPGQLAAKDIDVPGDISSAAFFIVAAACIKGSKIEITNTGINPTRDGIIRVLKKMGAGLRIENERMVCNEPVGDITAEYSPLTPVSLGKEDIPSVIDEIPVLAVAATQASGISEIRGAGELKVKESDRIKHLVAGLSEMGADIRELDDGMTIKGPVRLRGVKLKSVGDHRLAMAFTVAALIADGKTEIEDYECIKISYPRFKEDLISLGAGK